MTKPITFLIAIMLVSSCSGTAEDTLAEAAADATTTTVVTTTTSTTTTTTPPTTTTAAPTTTLPPPTTAPPTTAAPMTAEERYNALVSVVEENMAVPPLSFVETEKAMIGIGCDQLTTVTHWTVVFDTVQTQQADIAWTVLMSQLAYAIAVCEGQELDVADAMYLAAPVEDRLDLTLRELAELMYEYLNRIS